MLFDHLGRRPSISSGAYVSPTAVICGDVSIGPGTAVGFGTVITAESGPVRIGANCVIMENAVLRGVSHHPLEIGANVLVGPHAHLTGATIHDCCFVATGASVFNGAEVGAGSIIRINAVVQVNSTLPENSDLPIGWVAVGQEIFSPDRGDDINAAIAEQDFRGSVFGTRRALPSASTMPEITTKYAKQLARHRDDSAVISKPAE